MAAPLFQVTPAGLYCEAGGFYVDPWRPVDRAVITHAHGDHARRGSDRYLAAAVGKPVLQSRLGPEARLDALAYGERIDLNGVRLSLHPAGHILGSAQVRAELHGEVWVISGDYKLADDPTCAGFEPLRCHAFITEATFGLPIYRWPAQESALAEINEWWRQNRDIGRPSVLFAYALGKAQRLLASVDASIGPIYVHGAVGVVNRAYEESGVALPETRYTGRGNAGSDWSSALIVAPPSAHASVWTRKFGDYASGFASGWMRVRGARRRRGIERGFVLSDHADWPGLLGAVEATGAERVFVTHGATVPVARWLQEQGLEAYALRTRYEGEQDEEGESEPDATERP